jgi:hypothetical protein
MKNSLACVFVLLLVIGCETEAKLTFKSTVLKNRTCNTCPEIKIAVPEAFGEIRIAEAINTAIHEEIIYALKFEDSIDASTIPEAMQSFTKSYQDFKKEFHDEAIGWEAQINGEISYESPIVLSILLNRYVFAGGAHGNGTSVFLNFDKQGNIELENYELFSNPEGFLALSETKFRAEKEVPEKGPINATGFMFSGDVFHLPENLGFTKEGVQLIYNQYEIASYVDGPITITIPYKEANPFLKEEFRVN